MFRKVAIANRGEIAVRISRTLQEMGISALALYSEPDADALHVRAADEAYPLQGAVASETYLDIGKVVRAAREAGADAVHPGYGFLSENGDFAAAVEDAGMVFIGPTPDVVRRMGDKTEARRTMEAAGVPVVPGWTGNPDAAGLEEAAAAVGYPLLVKAAAGGGGRGMRRVDSAEGLRAALQAARAEALEAFGDGRVFLERYITRPRHIEFQVFGDTRGNVVHLFERECSVQRRHQKIVEESPSPALSPELRGRMAEAALAAARAVGYVNAGTVEFILSPDGEFYFLEMNTRLQVEHPVTELITGTDLVRAQILVAAGEPLPFRQDDLEQRGHAVECRIYAEDPLRGFLPGTGALRIYREPSGPGIRVDSGVAEGAEVSPYYDPLLAKLIVHAGTREAALERTGRALAHFPVLGVPHNISFLRALVNHPAFRAGDLHTHFLEEHALGPSESEPPVEALAAAALTVAAPERAPQARALRRPSPWREAGFWRPA